MTNHGYGSIWLKRVLIPFWVVDLAWLIFRIVITSTGSVMVNTDQDTVYFDAGAAILLAFCIFSLLLDIVLIILFALHKMGPITYLVFQCLKAAIWLFFFALDIVAVVSGRTTILASVFAAFMMCSSIGQLAYGAVLVNRKRHGKLNRAGGQRGAYRGVEGGARGVAGYDSPPRGSYAAQRPAVGSGIPLTANPFADGSKEPSPARAPSPGPSRQRLPPVPSPEIDFGTHSAFGKPGGSISYYNNPHATEQSYAHQGVRYSDN